MDFENIWVIATKDFGVFFRKKGILLSIIILPLSVAFGLPLVLLYITIKSDIDVSVLLALIDAFTFFFLIITTLIPTAIGSYSFMGEKIEKTFEPLLATPTTDNEILLGKSLVIFLPTLIAQYIALPIFVIFTDVITLGYNGMLVLPNDNFWIITLINIPLAILFSVIFLVFISSKANDTRTASQYGMLAVLPFGAIYLLIEIRVIDLDTSFLLLFSLVLFFIDVLFLILVSKTFRREEILTKWK